MDARDSYNKFWLGVTILCLLSCWNFSCGRSVNMASGWSISCVSDGMSMWLELCLAAPMEFLLCVDCWYFGTQSWFWRTSSHYPAVPIAWTWQPLHRRMVAWEIDGDQNCRSPKKRVSLRCLISQVDASCCPREKIGVQVHAVRHVRAPSMSKSKMNNIN